MSASFDILSFVYDAQPVPISAVWQHFGPGNYPETNETIEMLLSRGLLRRSRAAESYLDQLTVTAPGREMLEREKQQRRRLQSGAQLLITHPFHPIPVPAPAGTFFFALTPQPCPETG